MIGVSLLLPQHQMLKDIRLTYLLLVVPCGRFMPIRADLVGATKSEAEGGNGSALKFWKWSEDQIVSYL